MLKNSDQWGYKQAGQKLTNRAKKSIIRASEIARQFGYAEAGNIHLLFAVYCENGSLGSNILKDLNVNKESFLSIIKRRAPKTPRLSHINLDVNPFSADIKRAFTRAYAVAKEFNYPYVGTEHLVYALLESEDPMIKDLIAGTKISEVSKSIKSLFEPAHLSSLSKMFNLPDIQISKTR